ncbi:glycosyltransferase [Anaeromicropila herbilytica]|uniref:Glycosyl transferase family 1 domain-containing protein n=1 Tax=Anaeromicropila herbilytica TaxID=2785025 RepID=A0A7R7IEN1_9FIRM|nr:glycosyltransferase [Anaeromicropila herbilytica]BCN32284.1 hypothetical protein bsdtb5_35790 [Anaeromicropila herbilytica]
MRILHYFLGFPPYRTGGLTKYAFDLMQAQYSQNHKVIALWPGQMGILFKKTAIKKRKNVNGIENYEIINPLPVPLDEGIIEFDEYMKSCGLEVYIEFLEKLNLNVIHIHTLMGLHKEFLEVANALKIRIIFTSHDYFGLCPKVTLYRYGVQCEDDHGCKDCIQCNNLALSIKKIQLMQSPIYRILKNSFFIKYLRIQHRKEFFTNEVIPLMEIHETDAIDIASNYRILRSYYIKMLSCVDLIHFNSILTESVYQKYFIPKKSRVMTITHKGITDNRKVNEWKPGEILKITCLAPAKPFKGFLILKQALDDLWDSGQHNFELKLFGPVPDIASYMRVQEEGYQYDQLSSIMAETDVLVALSIWYETFGFTVLEAISYGVPVIVSDHVGAKDIIGDGGIVVKAGSKDELKKEILSLTPDKLKKLRLAIQKDSKIKTWQQFLNENNSLYLGLL